VKEFLPSLFFFETRYGFSTLPAENSFSFFFLWNRDAPSFLLAEGEGLAISVPIRD